MHFVGYKVMHSYYYIWLKAKQNSMNSKYSSLLLEQILCWAGKQANVATSRYNDILCFLQKAGFNSGHLQLMCDGANGVPLEAFAKLAKTTTFSISQFFSMPLE